MQVTLRKYGFVTFALLSLTLGITLNQSNQDDLANMSWALGGVVGLTLSVSWLIRSLRSGALGSDALAVISIIATGATNEWLAASIISVMLATGRALEVWAQGRASSHLDALVSRAPHDAHVLHNNEYIDKPLTEVPVGTLVLVRAGEVVPLDGILQSEALFDESALSGEPEPIWRDKESLVKSGVVNAGSSVLIRTTTTSADSTYASLINLVASAKQQATQGVRLANKWAIRFVPIALGLALATWLISGDVKQAVAVIVAATPCPLILAVPVAIVSGISRASKVGVIIKTGSALEQLSRVEVVLIDKTGTLTEGGPKITKSLWAEGVNDLEVLSLAASLEQHSSNIVARAMVASAKERALPFLEATDVVETPGHGLTGLVEGKIISVGQPTGELPSWAEIKSHLITEIQVDGVIVGYLGLSDPVRLDAKETLENLFRLGVKRILLVSGDREETVANVATELGITEHFSALTPEQKLIILKQTQDQTSGSVAVVGDGINDAPALAAADIGIAMGARGATAASQSSDVVIIEDSIGRLSDAVAISKTAAQRAIQASSIGMGLAFIAMTGAAFGFLSPGESAIAQEFIDVAAISLALVNSKAR
jgi:heavy metal translocating P-type ATPase